MAMRPYGYTSMYGANPPRQFRTTYESFHPKSEWKEEYGAANLMVYLPGFLREQIQLTYDETKRALSVYGERPLPNNRRISFNEAYNIPESYDSNELKTQFGRGVLTISFPKILPPKTDLKQYQDNTTQQTPSPPKAAAPTTAIEKQRNGKDVAAGSPETAPSNAKSQKAQEGTTPPKVTTSTTNINGKERDGKEVEAFSSDPQEATTTSSRPKIQKVEGDTTKQTDGQQAKGMVATPEITVEKETYEERKVSIVANSAIPKSDKKKNDETRTAKPKSTKIKGDSTAKEDAKDLAMHPSEERQLLMNMGASVLVIMALGANIAYYLISSPKN